MAGNPVFVDGDFTTTCFELKNTGKDICHLAQGILTVPAGLELIGVDIHTIGVFNLTTNTWTIGDIAGETSVTGCFQFKVTDITQAIANTFEVQMAFSSSCADDVSNNTAICVINVTDINCADITITI